MNIKKLSAVTFTCAMLLAGNTYASTDYQMSCDINISSDIAFANKELLLQSAKQEDILFTANGSVLVSGKQIKLSKEEKALALNYFSEVENAIPMVVEITVEALKVTDIALVEVFSGLLGENSALPRKLNGRINGIATSVHDHVYQNPESLTFNSAQLKKELGLGTGLEQEIEQMKAEIVSSVMGQLIVAIGKSMMNGGGDFSALEKRMGNLAADIEQKAKFLGESLKDKTAGLCDKVEALDETETKLRKIKELRYLSTFHFTKKA